MIREKEDGELFDVVVAGERGVGKSALYVRLLSDIFSDCYDPVIQDKYRKEFLVDDKPCCVEFHEVEEVGAVGEQWLAHGEGFLFLYSVQSRKSLDVLRELHAWYERVKDGTSFPIVVVGNKKDIPDHQREVSEQEGQELGKQLACPALEMSVKTKENIVLPFELLVRAMRIQRQEKELLRQQQSQSNKCVLM